MFGFTLDQQIGEFVLSHDNIRIPESGKIYSFNEGNYAMWSDGLKKYMDSLKARHLQPARISLRLWVTAEHLGRSRATLAVIFCD